MTMTDHDGRAVTVGAAVRPATIADGCPAYVHRGIVVGVGRTRVHVRWDDVAYEMGAMSHHAPLPEDIQVLGRETGG